MKDKFIKGLLVVIAVLLIVNLLNRFISPLDVPEVLAKSAQQITFRGNGIGLACSDDGKYVYVAGNGIIIRSADYGKTGSWEAVVE